MENRKAEKATVDGASIHPVVMSRFADRMPADHHWFAFVDPEEPSRWIVGWMDSYHVREEGGSSYRHNDTRLTWWYPLPDVPSA